MTTHDTAQPTKGPWKIGPVKAEGPTSPWWLAWIHDADGSTRAKAYGPTKQECAANARLIAAAWEMRDLLKAALIEDHEGMGTYAAAVWEKSARALLAKIEG